MTRSLPALLFVLGLIVSPSFGQEPDAAAPCQCRDDTSSLRLFFPPEVSHAQQGQSAFQPQVARLFVDDVFVGNAILNLHGHNPTLRFGAGAHTIRVELNDRKFQSKITFLGRGSTQILFVDFDTPPTIAKQ